MLVYQVSWSVDENNSKGKGRVPKSGSYFSFTVLCRNSKDAMSCLDWYFSHEFNNPQGLDVSDGLVKLSRVTLDSRGFNVRYLLMDGIKRPVKMDDLKTSLSDLSFNIY